MFPLRISLRLAGLATIFALLTGCTGAPGATPFPPSGGTTYVTASGATVSVSGRVGAEGMAAR